MGLQGLKNEDSRNSDLPVQCTMLLWFLDILYTLFAFIVDVTCLGLPFGGKKVGL